MNKYHIITLVGLLILVVAIPAYGLTEPIRMEISQAVLRQEFVSDAAVMYVENCAICHGAAGEGIGANPALDSDGLRDADYDFLYKTIARGRYDTAMTGWHADEGGIYNDYEIDELVALIRYGDWPQVNELAAQQGLIPPSLPVPDVDDDFLAQIAALDPQGEVWAAGLQVFAANCTTCHGVNGEGSSLGVVLNSDEVRATDAAELSRIITEGVPGTMMAGWDGALADEEIETVVAFLRNWDVITAAGLELIPPAPIQIDLNNPEEVLALGERLFSTTCVSCHGDNGSGGTGPALNSQQFLTRKTDEQIADTIIYGGHRRNSIMPAFGDRLTSVEIDAIVQFVRAWEPTAPWVENPRGTEQGGGGPPWLRATPDPDNPIAPQGEGGGPPEGRGPSTAGGTESHEDMGPTLHFNGEVIRVADNLLVFRSDDGAEREAMLGPPWFWSENGIELTPGDRVELEGFDSPDHMEINWISNLTTGDYLALRTPDGMPVWTQ